MDKLQIPLIAVLHEVGGHKEFAEGYWKDSPLFLDTEKRFYGPKERRMMWSGFLRFAVWRQIVGAYKKNIVGNLKGDGTLLGSVFVIAPGNPGKVIFEHREGYFGDYVNTTQVLSAAKSISNDEQ